MNVDPQPCSILNIIFVLGGGNLKNRNLLGDEIPTQHPGSYSSILNIIIVLGGNLKNRNSEQVSVAAYYKYDLS